MVGKLLRDGLIEEVSVASPAKMADYASLIRPTGAVLALRPPKLSGRVHQSSVPTVLGAMPNRRWSRWNPIAAPSRAKCCFGFGN